MIRDLNYSIRFGLDKDSTFMLTREMTQIDDPNEGLQETYAIEDPQVHEVRFTPPEFALLHGAIHEMLRMHDQHVDVLQDGAEQQVAEPDEAKREHNHAHDHGHERHSHMHNYRAHHGLLEVWPVECEPAVPPHSPEAQIVHEIAMEIATHRPTLRLGDYFECPYCHGRWQLGKREQSMLPESHHPSCIWRRAKEYEARVAGEPEPVLAVAPALTEKESLWDYLSKESQELLRLMATGIELCHVYKHTHGYFTDKQGQEHLYRYTLMSFLCEHGVIEALGTPVDMPGSITGYVITDTGRALLAEQELDEAESKDMLNQGAMNVLEDLDCGARMNDTHPLFGELHGRGLLKSHTDYYTISDVGRAVLAAQEPDDSAWSDRPRTGDND